MALNLANIVVDFLQQNPEQNFTAREITRWIYKTYTGECRDKQKRSNTINNKEALFQQIITEIGSRRPHIQKSCPQIKTTEGRPRKYYFTESTDSLEIDYAESIAVACNSTVINSPPTIKEYDLYPVLSEFLRLELNIYSKRIYERCSRNSRGLVAINGFIQIL